MRPTASRLPLAALAAAFVLASAGPIAGQGPPERSDRFRFGILLGGTGLVGVTAEYLRNDWGGELTVGTIGFRDLSVALAGKRYFGEGRLRPAAGFGLWTLALWSEEGSGSALLLRVPLAVDWAVADGHALGIEVGLNRAVAIRRLDPDDDTPPRSSIVPFPGFYYRHGTER